MNKKIIFLVEDNPDDEALLIRALKKNKFANEIIVAHDGAEALNFLFSEGEFSSRKSRELPDLILLDLKIPKIDGLEVLRRIRGDNRTKYVPVVVLTTSTEQRDIIQSYNFGANSYIQKPVDFNDFIDATRQLGNYWLTLNQTIRLIN